MSDLEPPVGKRFSHVYLQSDHLTEDSVRARVRLGAFLESDRRFTDGLASLIVRELGVTVPSGYDCYLYADFVENCAIRDLLDLVTLVWSKASKRGDTAGAKRWLDECRRIFAEEAWRYRIDDGAGVHFMLDAEFEVTRVSVIAGLGAQRYRAVLDAYERAHRALDTAPPDLKDAVRSAFESVEILFKLICSSAPRIGGSEIKQNLEPIVSSRYAHDTTATRAAIKMLRSLGEWVDGVHFYRHGDKVEEPTLPPAEFAFIVVDQAASYLRWLAELDAARAK